MRASLVALVCASTPAFADDLVAKNGVEWALAPSSAWFVRYTDARPHQIQIADEAPADPKRALLFVELQPKTDGTLVQVEAALATELKRDGVTFAGEKVTSFTITKKATKAAAADVSDQTHVARQIVVHVGTGTINGRPARYAIAQVPGGRSKASSVLVAMIKPGMSADVEKSSWEWFNLAVKRAVYLKSPIEQTADRAKDTKAKPLPPYAPTLEPYLVLGDVTATSSQKGGAPLWKTAVFDVDDAQLPVPKTAWCEAKEDEGIGESLTLKFVRPNFTNKILIAAGNWSTPSKFAASNKVTRVVVTFGDKTKTVEIPPEQRWVSVDVGWGYPSISIKIDGVQKGATNDSCISGVIFGTGRRLPVLRGIDDAALDALKMSVVTLYKTVEKDNPKQLPRAYNSNDARSNIYVTQTSATELELAFPYDGDTLDTWRLAWKEGAWKIASFATRPAL